PDALGGVGICGGIFPPLAKREAYNRQQDQGGDAQHHCFRPCAGDTHLPHRRTLPDGTWLNNMSCSKASFSAGAECRFGCQGSPLSDRVIHALRRQRLFCHIPKPLVVSTTKSGMPPPEALNSNVIVFTATRKVISHLAR